MNAKLKSLKQKLKKTYCYPNFFKFKVVLFTPKKYLKKINLGVANDVYMVDGKTKKIYKFYKNTYNFQLSQFLKNHCIKNNIGVAKKIVGNTNYCVESFMAGQHINKLNKIQMTALIDLVQKITPQATPKDNTIFNKVKIFYNYFAKNMAKKIDATILKKLLERYSIVLQKLLIQQLVVVHGDLSFSNILWQGNKISAVLDFDEAILAPKQYEFAVTLIKFCKKIGKINLKLAHNMLKLYKQKTDCNLDEVFDAVEFYVIKVLLEKFYLYETNNIDLEDKTQKKDYWKGWLRMFDKMEKVNFWGKYD